MNTTPPRKKKKYISPNPLFVKWLTEWKQEAAEKGLKTQYVYAKALSSLKKYPLPLSSGKEAKILEYFGDKICAMLDAKLIEWKQSNCGSSSSCQSSSRYSVSSFQASIPRICISSPQKSKVFSKSNKINIGISDIKLGSSGGSQSSTESDGSSLQAVGTFNSSTSPRKTKQPPRSFDTAIGIKTVHLGRVTTISKSSLADVDVNCDSDSYVSDSNGFYLLPGSFSIVLCVDNCETFSGQGRNKKLFLAELQKTGIALDVRKLHVGDFLWIARENGGGQRELVLDFIVERKRMDDLARSIKDGRFKEQKFRMKTCGLKNPVYLVEKCRESNYLGLPLSTCEQAIINTQVIDGFLIKRTSNVKESANYLTTMTNMLRNKFQNTMLMSASKEAVLTKKLRPNTFMTFNEFNSSSMKNKKFGFCGVLKKAEGCELIGKGVKIMEMESLTVREMFAKHLLQFHGLSVDRAIAIVDTFKTPAKFFEAYDSCVTEAEKEKLVSSIKFGMQKKNVGPTLSRSLYQYYCAETPPK